jgi:hypothetical protein
MVMDDESWHLVKHTNKVTGFVGGAKNRPAPISEGDVRKIVEQMIRTAEKQFMQQLPGRPMEPDALGGSDLNAKLRNLQVENEKLKRELADYNRTQKGLVLPPKTTSEKTADKPATTEDGKTQRVRQYTIAKGDTLSSIARKTYGESNPARVSAIFNANRDNRGIMAINKDTEELENVAVPLSSLDLLQAQHAPGFGPAPVVADQHAQHAVTPDRRRAKGGDAEIAILEVALLQLLELDVLPIGEPSWLGGGWLVVDGWTVDGWMRDG